MSKSESSFEGNIPSSQTILWEDGLIARIDSIRRTGRGQHPDPRFENHRRMLMILESLDAKPKTIFEALVLVPINEGETNAQKRHNSFSSMERIKLPPMDQIDRVRHSKFGGHRRLLTILEGLHATPETIAKAFALLPIEESN